MRISNLILLLIPVVLCSCTPVQEPSPGVSVPSVSKTPAPPAPLIISADPPSMKFIHACYVHGHRLQSRLQLDFTRFDQFNIFYMIAGPKWTPADFDLPSAAAINKLVDNHVYPAGDKGLSLVPDFISRAHRSKVKVLLSIQDGDFPPIAQSPLRRACFASVMAAFVKKYDYDGLEIDWENNLDLAMHGSLMVNLREALNELKKSSSRHYYLTTAILAGKEYSPYLASRLSQIVDWVNVMTYDIGGGLWGDTPTHNTPLDSIQSYMAKWSVFPPGKLCVGLASYGFYYKGIKPGRKSKIPLNTIGRYFYYNELSSLLTAGWKETFDYAAMAPYYSSPDGRDFVTLDNAQSLDSKMRWIFSRPYRGVFWWEFQCDYFWPKPGQKQAAHPLVDHVEQKIRRQTY